MHACTAAEYASHALTPSRSPSPPPSRPVLVRTSSESRLSGEIDVAAAARNLEGRPPEEVIAWADAAFGGSLALSTSFGIQSAALLHLATRVRPDIPIVWVDTGYLPPETYRYAETLRESLDLNLVVAQASLSPARMEALHGRLWEHRDVEALNLYDRIRKVEPMKQALHDLGAKAWMSGLRSGQTEHRSHLPVVGRQAGRVKILPILRWSTRDTYTYMKQNDLPQHPLFEQGYATVGDWHSSRAVTNPDEHERDTRFHGLKQECGLHLDDDQAASLQSSEL